MCTIIFVFLVVAGNMVIGAAVWDAVDTKDRAVFRWYSECPASIAWFVQPLILTFWPVGLYLWFRNARGRER